MLLFSGSSHPVLAQEVASHLGIELSPLKLGRFPDGEISLQVPVSVRGKDVFILQTLALDPNNYLVELLVILDAMKRASANSITAVIPYFGYCRQDRKDKPRQPISAKLIADTVACAGATHVLTMDLHAGQLEGFFDIPVDHIHALPELTTVLANTLDKRHLVVVAPDIGSVKLAHRYASFLNVDFAIVDKQRITSAKVDVMAIIGEVEGKDVLLADDMCSTAGTLVSAAKACQGKGAKRVFALVTHGIFVGDSVRRIEESPIEALYMSNTIPYTERLVNSTKIKSLSVARPFAQAIHCIASNESITF